MILTKEYIIPNHILLADVESLRLSLENTITKTVTINKTHIVYDNNLLNYKILINKQSLLTIPVS